MGRDNTTMDTMFCVGYNSLIEQFVIRVVCTYVHKCVCVYACVWTMSLTYVV